MTHFIFYFLLRDELKEGLSFRFLVQNFKGHLSFNYKTVLVTEVETPI